MARRVAPEAPKPGVVLAAIAWPVNITVGPDGAIYVCDMYEGQIAHLRHHEGQVDKSSGRIYRLKTKGAAPIKPFDLGKLSSAEQVAVLADENKWFRRQALRLLADRNDASVVPLLLEHYGQLVVYYRLAGLVPPESRPKK